MSIRKARPTNAVAGGTKELGSTGLQQSGGVVREELLVQLQGSRGKKLMREMSENDAIVGAFLFAVEQMIRQVTWKVVPGAPGDLETALFVDSCREDLTETWAETITEVLSMLVFGFQISELIYKKRNGPTRDPLTSSRFTDGRIGWRSLAPRSQESIAKWEFAPEGGQVLGAYQTTASGTTVFLPAEKYLLFRTKVRKGNPEGYSILRNAYRSWYFKKRFEEIEGIGVERDLAGLPTLTAPEGMDLWNTSNPRATEQRAVAETLIRSIRRDEQEGVLLPFGWKLELLSTGGARASSTTDIINRYDQRIAMTVLADFILLGHSGKFGSFALSKTKTSAFVMSLYGYLNMIRDVFNRYAIPRLLEINGLPLEFPPKLDYGDVDAPNLNELGNFIRNITGSEYVLATPLLLQSLLQAAGLPSDESDIAKRLTTHAGRVEDALVQAVRDAMERSAVEEDQELMNES